MCLLIHHYNNLFFHSQLILGLQNRLVFSKHIHNSVKIMSVIYVAMGDNNCINIV